MSDVKLCNLNRLFSPSIFTSGLSHGHQAMQARERFADVATPHSIYFTAQITGIFDASPIRAMPPMLPLPLSQCDRDW